MTRGFMSGREIEALAHDVSPSEYGVAGWDVAVSVDDQVGEVTLVPDHCGVPKAWGSRDNWVDSKLLAWIEEQADGLQILEDLESLASQAVQSSGLEPAEQE
jgi:hypothetical protein